MVNAIADDIMAEVAEAEAAGLKPEELNPLRGMVDGGNSIDGMGMAYEIPDADKAAFVAGWRLEIDAAGVERGVPVKLAKGGLGNYLAKKRPIDGGRLFTLRMPENLVAPRLFQCFVAPNFCAAKSDTKMNLIDHMSNAHPRESAHYAKEIQVIRDSVAAENPALQAIVQQIAAMSDPGIVKVPEVVREQYDATLPEVDTSAGVVTTLSMPEPTYECGLCDWKPNSTLIAIGRISR